MSDLSTSSASTKCAAYTLLAGDIPTPYEQIILLWAPGGEINAWEQSGLVRAHNAWARSLRQLPSLRRFSLPSHQPAGVVSKLVDVPTETGTLISDTGCGHAKSLQAMPSPAGVA